LKKEARFLHIKCGIFLCAIIVSRWLTIDNAIILPRQNLCSKISHMSFTKQIRYSCLENDVQCMDNLPIVECGEITFKEGSLRVINAFAKRVALKAEVLAHGEILPQMRFNHDTPKREW
jgi:hypothetical protein